MFDKQAGVCYIVYAREGKLTAILSLSFFLYMELLIFGVSLSSLFSILLFVKYQLDFFNKVNERLLNFEKSIGKIHGRIDQIFTVDIPTENEASKPVPNDVELSENNPLSLPKDVKFSVEGGDTQVPPGFKEN